MYWVAKLNELKVEINERVWDIKSQECPWKTFRKKSYVIHSWHVSNLLYLTGVTHCGCELYSDLHCSSRTSYQDIITITMNHPEKPRTIFVLSLPHHFHLVFYQHPASSLLLHFPSLPMLEQNVCLNVISPWLPVCHVEVMSLIINFITLQPAAQAGLSALWHFTLDTAQNWLKWQHESDIVSVAFTVPCSSSLLTSFF